MKEEIEKLPGGKVSWLEYLVVGQSYFNSVIAIILIVLVIGYIGAPAK